MHAEAGKGVEVNGQRRHQRFAFTGLHLCDHPAVQRHAANELHVEVHHLPCQGPLVDDDLAATEAAGTVFDDGVGFGQDLFQVLGAGFAEETFDLVEGGFRRVD